MDISNAILVLVACLVATLIGSVLYFISVSSMKEKTYDEVKAEQKKKAEEFLAQGRSAKEKAKDKKLKKAGKKVKEKKSSESIEQSSEEGDTSSKSHVAFVEPPVVLDTQPIVIQEMKKKSNKKKEKPILVNKGEITPIAEVPPPVFNHFEQIVPKDDLALKHSISREEIEAKAVEPQKHASTKQNKGQLSNLPKEVKVDKPQASKQTQIIQKPAEKNTNNVKPIEKPTQKLQEKAQDKPKPVEEMAVKQVVKQVQNVAAPVTVVENPSPSTKNSRKKRNDLSAALQQMGDMEAVNVSLLMPLLHKAELSRTDVQELINLLLNKQQGLSADSAEWIEGRQDPVVKLKKQLAEKEKALSEEQQASVALQSKVKELRSELNTERHNCRQLEEGLNALQVDHAARLKHSADEKQALLLQIQQLQAQLSEEHILLCKVQEDQAQTQNVMQQELLTQRQQLEMHIARLTDQHQETVSSLESQLSQMTIELQQQGDLQEKELQLQELRAEIERVRSKCQFDTSHLQSEVNSLTDQLNLKRSESDKLSSLVQSLQAENKRLAHQVSSVCVEAQQLRDENETLAAQVTASMERPATEGRENGDSTYTESKHIDTDPNIAKLHEKERLVEKLQDDIISKEKEINRFKTDFSHQETVIKKLRNELDTAYLKSEGIYQELSSYKSLVQEHESVIRALREESESAHRLVNTLRDDLAKNKVEMARLSQDCATIEQLESRDSSIEKLTSELNTHKTQLADQMTIINTLKTEIEKYKTEATNKGLIDNAELERLRLQVVESGTELKTVKAQADQLRGELTALQSASAQLTQDRDRLREQLSTQQHKNDEMETRLRSEVQEKIKQHLQRLWPHVTVDNNLEYEVWLERFAESMNIQSSESNDAGMLAEVEQQNCQLQELVTHYKTIIVDTEGMLSRLQGHVEQEEGQWGNQLLALQSQLQAVTQERDNLQASLKIGVTQNDDGSGEN